MPIPPISTLPTPPSRTDTGNFAARADAFLGALPTFQTEMNAAAAAINAVYFPPALRNLLINGGFQFWQRATSQTSNGYGSDDRWSNTHAGSTKTHSLQSFALGQTAVPGEPQFYSRTVVTSVAGAGNLVAKQQRIEGVRALAGRNARVSFWAKADAARSIAIDFLQRFGTGGSPSADVSGIGAQKFSLTTSWQRFSATVAIPSLAGKTIGTSATDCLEFTIWFDAGSSFNARTAALGQQSGTFDIANVQIEEGTEETAFEARPPGLEFMLCQRFYQARAAGLGAYGMMSTGTSASRYWAVAYPVPLRAAATPTVALSSGTFVPFAGSVTAAGFSGEVVIGNSTTAVYMDSYSVSAEL
jgi:hypothetical protein